MNAHADGGCIHCGSSGVVDDYEGQRDCHACGGTGARGSNLEQYESQRSRAISARAEAAYLRDLNRIATCGLPTRFTGYHYGNAEVRQSVAMRMADTYLVWADEWDGIADRIEASMALMMNEVGAYETDYSHGDSHTLPGGSITIHEPPTHAFEQVEDADRCACGYPVDSPVHDGQVA